MQGCIPNIQDLDVTNVLFGVHIDWCVSWVEMLAAGIAGNDILMNVGESFGDYLCKTHFVVELSRSRNQGPLW